MNNWKKDKFGRTTLYRLLSFIKKLLKVNYTSAIFLTLYGYWIFLHTIKIHDFAIFALAGVLKHIIM